VESCLRNWLRRVDVEDGRKPALAPIARPHVSVFPIHCVPATFTAYSSPWAIRGLCCHRTVSHAGRDLTDSSRDAVSRWKKPVLLSREMEPCAP
jgi:hypothetical protein